MKILEYTLRFDTPAFLGNAEQNAQWRTPPIKALLRQWWRVAYAADKGFAVNLAAMRREEGLLFGNAWLQDNFCKGRVRIRLGQDESGRRWHKPNIGNLGNIGMVCHPEVNRPGLPNCPGGAPGKTVESGQYLGYGPFQKANAAIQANESASLSFAFPTTDKDPDIRLLLESNSQRIENALWLMNRFGALGGRSRNGWGSFSLLPAGEGWGEGKPPLRPWQDCLQRDWDWPHAIGQDAQKRPLIWQTEAFADWKALMQRLAAIKIGLRTQKSFAFTTGKNATNTEARHWLSYPVTNHSVKAWGNNARLPNTLRFKVRPTRDGKLIGVIFHVPHRPPPDFHPDQTAIIQVWQRVHGYLDQPAQQLTRIPE